MSGIDVDRLLLQLTLDEKLSLLAGGSQWRTTRIPRLGIPPLKVSDGPSGARGEVFGEGVPAAFIPCGVSLGATWDESLIYRVGQLLAEECKSKSASVSLAPTMCIHRHPLGGRNFESFSEDPYLTGKLASAHVRGLQSRGVGATPKHFVANDQETSRFKVDVRLSTRALREVYLLPFQMVVRDANPWCMMTAYNKVNGHHCDASKELLTDIARGEWGWDGVFMSDWGGTTSSVESLNAGLDLEMPGPPVKRSHAMLEKPIREGLVDLKAIDASAKRILNLLQKAGRFEDPSDDREVCRDDPAIAAFLRQVATAGIVMLKNEGNVLPLRPEEGLRKLAVIGPNAKKVVAGGGGSSYIKAPYWTSVFDSVATRFENTSTEILFSLGAKVARFLPTPLATVVRNPDTNQPGAAMDWRVSHNLASDIVATTHVDNLYFMSFGVVPPEVGRATDFSFTMRTLLTPQTTGKHRLSLASIGPAELYVDGEKMGQRSGAFDEKGPLFFTYGSDETIASMHLIAGRTYDIRIDCRSHDRQLDPQIREHLDPMEDQFQGLRLGYEEYDAEDRPAEAAALAESCDAAIVVVGRDKEWETEGEDIPVFELPGEQVRLIQEVAKVCQRTIVVIQAGTPVLMEPWIHDVQGVLYTWYQGQELGNAAADVITGDVNPSGRLPVTFPGRLQDCPAFSSFPGEQLQSSYAEGLFVGYKWWDLVDIKPLFPIGFGLSYNTFGMRIDSIDTVTLREGGILALTAHIRNTGGCRAPGQETVIAWFSQRSPKRLRRPEKQICGFAKSPALLPGEEEPVSIKVPSSALGMYDPKKAAWVIDAGTDFNIMLGTNASDAVFACRVHVPEEIVWRL